MEELSGEPSTLLENTVSQYMRHAWASFAKDPVDGLKALGWPLYNASEETLVRLGHDEEESASYVSPDDFDTICKSVDMELSEP